MNTVSSKQRPWDCLDINMISAVMLTVHERYCGDSWGEGWKDDKWKVMAQDFRPHYEECFPLHVAVMEADAQEVEDLLASGADVEARDCLGSSAYNNINWAREGAESVALLLLNYGAKVDDSYKAGRGYVFAQAYQRRADLLNRFGRGVKERALDRPAL